MHVIVGNVKAVSLPLVLAGQRYTVEPLARAEVKQEPPMGRNRKGKKERAAKRRRVEGAGADAATLS